MERLRISPEMKNWHSAHALADRFVGRWDLYALQRPSGQYVSIKEPLLGRYLIQHLKGSITLGTYVLDAESRAKFTVLDADDEKGRTQLLDLAVSLEREGLPSYIEESRRGCHLWFFYAQPILGATARSLGRRLLTEHDIDGIEVFPKQDHLTTGPGSLIRLPFGLHRVSKTRYSFINPDGRALADDLHDQIEILKRAQVVSDTFIERYSPQPNSPEKPTQTKRDKVPIWDRIKEVMSVAEFIGEYVELTPTGSGYVAYCPFHPDQHKSFGVNEEGNFWNCFAGCGGGSIIDFYMLHKQVDFKTACDELGSLFRLTDESASIRAWRRSVEDTVNRDIRSDKRAGRDIYQADHPEDAQSTGS